MAQGESDGWVVVFLVLGVSLGVLVGGWLGGPGSGAATLRIRLGQAAARTLVSAPRARLGAGSGARGSRAAADPILLFLCPWLRKEQQQLPAQDMAPYEEAAASAGNLGPEPAPAPTPPSGSGTSLEKALNLSPHPHARRAVPPSTGRSRTPLERAHRFSTPRTKGHEALLIAMMGCDPDMQSIDWADRMIMQIDPVTEDELSWRASYTEEMMRDLIDRAREISETTADPITQLPPLPGIGSQSISPTIPLGGAGSDVTHANTGGLNVPVGSTIQTDTLSSSVPYAPPSDIEEFGAGQPLEMVRDPEIREDSIDNVVRAPTLPATDFSQELRACYTREDDRDYSAAKKSAL